MDTLSEIKNVEKKAEELRLVAEEKAQGMIKEAQMEAERMQSEGRKALKEKLTRLRSDEEAKTRKETDRTLDEARKRSGEMLRKAGKKLELAVELTLSRFVKAHGS